MIYSDPFCLQNLHSLLNIYFMILPVIAFAETIQINERTKLNVWVFLGKFYSLPSFPDPISTSKDEETFIDRCTKIFQIHILLCLSYKTFKRNKRIFSNSIAGPKQEEETDCTWLHLTPWVVPWRCTGACARATIDQILWSLLLSVTQMSTAPAFR